MVEYLTADEVILMNELALKSNGTLISRSGIEGAVNRPQTMAHYENADLITQAAFLYMGIALAHAFRDGNKRTATAAGEAFLSMNGYQLIAADREVGQQVEAMIVRKETGEEPLPLFLKWLQQHVQSL